MSAPLSCPHCGRPATISVEDRGARGACPHCGSVFSLDPAASQTDIPVVPTYQGRGGTVKVECPACGARLRLAANLAGKRARCRCGHRMRLSEDVIKAQSPAPPRPSRRPPGATADATFQSMLNELDDDETSEQDEPTTSGWDEPDVAPAANRPRAYREETDLWKWWYFVIAGVLIAALSVLQIIQGEPWIRIGGRRNGPIGGLILAALAIAVGLFSRPRH